MRYLLKPLSSVLVLLWLVGVKPVVQQGPVIYVDCRAPDLDKYPGPPNGTKERPYDMLTEAVKAAPVGGRIVVRRNSFPPTGTYPESLIIDKNLTIETECDGQDPCPPPRIGQPMSTQMICALTGESSINKTASRFGLFGTDLGAPVEHNGRIYFLFGDTLPDYPRVADTGVAGYRPRNGDSIAFTPASSDPESCLTLNFITAPDSKYLAPKIKAPNQRNCSGRSWVPVYAFEVPTGAFSANGRIYTFYSTCFNGDDNNPVMGKTVLARLDNPYQACYNYIYTVSCRPGNTNCGCDDIPETGNFINVTPVVVNNSDIPNLPDNADPQGQGVLLWGSGLYRKSDVYLAYLPLNDIENRKALRYASLSVTGNLIKWSEKEEEATRIFDSNPNKFFLNPSVGELSVAWNPYLKTWLMLYGYQSKNGSHFILYRKASVPWGPWSDPEILFDGWVDRGYCHFMHVAGDKRDRCAPYHKMPEEDDSRWGGEYAPYIIPRFTRGDATSTTFYWAMSTWNPYQVALMKSTLQIACKCRAY
jgi:hypothetical protein